MPSFQLTVAVCACFAMSCEYRLELTITTPSLLICSQLRSSVQSRLGPELENLNIVLAWKVT